MKKSNVQGLQTLPTVVKPCRKPCLCFPSSGALFLLSAGFAGFGKITSPIRRKETTYLRYIRSYIAAAHYVLPGKSAPCSPCKPCQKEKASESNEPFQTLQVGAQAE